jgi:hypothetical protein
MEAMGYPGRPLGPSSAISAGIVTPPDEMTYIFWDFEKSAVISDTFKNFWEPNFQKSGAGLQKIQPMPPAGDIVAW